MQHPLLVVGTDFSDGARAALLNGRLLASRLGGEVRLVHVYDPPGGLPADLDGHSREWLRRCEIEPASLITRRGTAWLELAREARSLDAAMIVIGRHGRSGYQPIELGSTAARIGLAAHCPVMLVGDRVPARIPPELGLEMPVSLTTHS